ncbi:Purine nucleoside permease [Paramyrothecium foliicola]|nr:Purine nucleoside permease [Paramyrothecium foliicola]
MVASNNQASSSSSSKPKRRGRPIADDDRGDEALKARRERNREAQHIFRRRKQAAEAEQTRRMRRLEEVIEEMSSIFLGNVDEMLLSKAASQDPNLVTNVRGSVAKILSLAKEVAGSEEEGLASASSSLGMDGNGDRSSSPEEGSHSSSSSDGATARSPATPMALPGMLYPTTTENPLALQPQKLTPQVYGNGWFETPGLLDFGTTPVRLSPDSFPLRLVDTSVAKAYLLLLAAGNTGEVVGEAFRIFNASLHYRTREELLFKMRWLLGPGRAHILYAANAIFGDPHRAAKLPIESTGAIDVLAASTFPYEGDAKEKFVNAMDVYRQLERLGAKMVDRDTMEITVPCPNADPSGHPVANAMVGLNAVLNEDPPPPKNAWGYIGNYPSATPPGMTTVTMRLSAALLIESLCHVSMCLSRGPGFARHEICRAVETAVTQVYGGDGPGVVESLGDESIYPAAMTLNLRMFLVYALLMSLAPIEASCRAQATPTPECRQSEAIAPKIMIVSMWAPEAQVWHDRFPQSGLGDLTAVSISSVGLSMLYPQVFCTEVGNVCQVTLGEGEINAAASVMALVLSAKFDFRSTYFLIAGIAGVNPQYGTLGGVAFSRFAVQVALQYEVDPRDLPPEWSTGYIAYGRDRPLEYPSITYGTEVFEVNANLRDIAHSFASEAELVDADSPRQYRSRYRALGDSYSKAVAPPAVMKCDSATSDVYYSGNRLSQAFEDILSLWTNGSGTYCMTAQEDNATLEVLVRAAIEKLVDFSRVIIMRSGESKYGQQPLFLPGSSLTCALGSNFDRPPPDASDLQHLTRVDQNGFSIAIENLFHAGIAVVGGILKGWDCRFKAGVAPNNYIGDIFGSLGGQPDFGLGSITNGQQINPNQGVSKNGFAHIEMARRIAFGRKTQKPKL